MKSCGRLEMEKCDRVKSDVWTQTPAAISGHLAAGVLVGSAPKPHWFVPHGRSFLFSLTPSQPDATCTVSEKVQSKRGHVLR